MTEPIPPGATIGVVGGGQLGRMLAAAAHRTGYRVAVLTGGGKDTPAGLVAETEIAAGFDDEQAVARFVADSDVVTWEFENVVVDWALELEGCGVPVRPSPTVVATAQHRVHEKQALERIGVSVAPWRAADSSDSVRAAIADLGPEVVVKTARWGYDGKGQVRLSGAESAGWARVSAMLDAGSDPVVVEQLVDFDAELSVIVARGLDGALADHGVMLNTHVDHVLDTTSCPAPVSGSVSERATDLARRVADGIGLVGVMAVEMFLTGDGLLVNELAPRPHNSGHCTIEAAPASQFEQQLRAVTGLPLGDGTCRPAAMVQLLGDLWADGEPDWSRVLGVPGAHLHLYGKTEPRPGRKMGHITVLADSAAESLALALAVRERLVSP